MAKKKSRSIRRKTPKVSKQPSRAVAVAQQFAVVHNKALMNSARDQNTANAIKERMKPTSGENLTQARLVDLEKRRLELLK